MIKTKYFNLNNFKGAQKYQKIKNVFLSENNLISSSCLEIFGFMFREIFNEILETCLEIKNKQKHLSSEYLGILTSNDLFEACRLMQINKNSIINKINSFKVTPCKNFKKKYLFL